MSPFCLIAESNPHHFKEKLSQIRVFSFRAGGAFQSVYGFPHHPIPWIRSKSQKAFTEPQCCEEGRHSFLMASIEMYLVPAGNI